jgi:hypothetical protein
MPAMRQQMRQLFAKDIEVCELHLSLEDPMTPIFVPELEKMGFIFTAILPETIHGNSMIMQYFHGTHIDYDKIVLISDVANELLSYIRKNDPKAG